jgi:pyruvate dehydrogenase E1 component alpha subunit
LAKIDIRAAEAVEEAVRFAEESPFPVPEECLRDVYVSYPVEGGDL